jgi:hypothetical protein
LSAGATALAIALPLVAGCSQERGVAAPEAMRAPPGGLAVRLEDRVTPRPNQRISWSTVWRLCWRGHPGAQAYELRPLTGEGNPAALRRQEGRCFAIEAAAGENRRSEGLVQRETQLALQQGQLAYQVRAVLDERRVSEWSAPAAVGDRDLRR